MVLLLEIPSTTLGCLLSESSGGELSNSRSVLQEGPSRLYSGQQKQSVGGKMETQISLIWVLVLDQGGLLESGPDRFTLAIILL